MNFRQILYLISRFSWKSLKLHGIKLWASCVDLLRFFSTWESTGLNNKYEYFVVIMHVSVCVWIFPPFSRQSMDEMRRWIWKTILPRLDPKNTISIVDKNDDANHSTNCNQNDIFWRCKIGLKINPLPN